MVSDTQSFAASNKKPWYRRKRIIVAGIAALLIAWLQLQVPSNEGLWHEAQGRTAWVEFAGRIFTAHNVRDFRYGKDRAAAKVSGRHR